MSDVVSCPTCQASLRLPAGAATIRCPKCKTVLQVSDGPPPAAPPAPPPAPPLPFGQKAKPAKQKAKPVKAAAKTAGYLKPRVVDEEAEKADREAAERKRKRADAKDELAEFEEDEAEEQEVFDEVDDHCRAGRNALDVLKYGVIGYAGSVLLVFFSFLPVVIGLILTPLLFAGLVVGALSTLVIGVGFGMSIGGPKLARHIAVMGLLASLFQIGAMAAGVGDMIHRVADFKEEDTKEGFKGLTMGYYALGMSTNLVLMSDSPARIVYHYDLPWPGLVAAVFEFARLVFICQLVQLYAQLGKDADTAHKASNVVSRVFWVVLIASVFQLVITTSFDWFPPTDFMWFLGQGLHGLLFVIGIGWLGFQLYKTIQAIADTREVLIAERVTSKFDKLDVV